jgi:hypothetical protein
VVYFVKPEDGCVMKRLEGSGLVPELGEGEEGEGVTAVE